MSNSASQRTAHVPPRSTDDDVLGLAEELRQLGRTSDLVTLYLEEHLGLTHAQLRLLVQVSESPATVGPGREEVLAVLAERDLTTTDDDDQVAITEQGQVLLDQVEAIRIRLADRLLTELGTEEIRSLRTVVQQLITAAPQPVRTIA